MSGWRGPRQFPVHRTMSGRGSSGSVRCSRARASPSDARVSQTRSDLFRWPLHARPARTAKPAREADTRSPSGRRHGIGCARRAGRRPTRIRAASSRCPRTPARHAGTGPTNDSAPQGILASPGNAPLQARVSCRLASRPRFGSPSHGSLPPTRSPCAADAQGAWSPPACCGRRHCNDYRILRRRA